ncbi:MAG: RNA-directed DNA polymerase [Saprospiraceae bacterium]|nr:RNA-directed DNA polymerase [Saprospiraceae bacterium]
MATNPRIIKKRKDAIDRVRTTADICKILGENELRLQLMANSPRYKVYTIRKKNGNLRLIEDPEIQLKEVLRTINDHLQAVYYYQRPDCVHGFCISSTHDPDRNVVSNAQAHMMSATMLNIDLKDFFHQISVSQVKGIIKRQFHRWDNYLAAMIASLCTYKKRLPMGSPTSPILSNFAMLELDHELMQLSRVFEVTYTRYADDLTFSSGSDLPTDFVKMVRDALQHHGFTVNENKVKYYQASDIKIVTGIIVNPTGLSLPDDYMTQLRTEIDLYRNSRLVDAMYQTGMSERKMTLFEQEIIGKLNFGYMVMPDDPELNELNQLFEVEIDVESMTQSWLDIPYNMM